MSSEQSETRNRILQAAWTLLEDKQGSGVRMTDIAKAAGISRQAIYLHFAARSDLLISTTRYIDEAKDLDARLHASRTAKTGVARLDTFVEAWCGYIPEVYAVIKALLAIKDIDDAAALAWNDRMQAIRHGCDAAVMALHQDGKLNPDYSVDQATDLLWMLLSVHNWEQLTIDCKWSQQTYVSTTKKLAADMLVVD